MQFFKPETAPAKPETKSTRPETEDKTEKAAAEIEAQHKDDNNDSSEKWQRAIFEISCMV